MFPPHTKQKASDLTSSLSVEIYLIKTSLLRAFLSCAHTQTQTITLVHNSSPLNLCDVMRAAEEIQEVINSRLFSQEKEKQWSIKLWEPVESTKVSHQLLTH